MTFSLTINRHGFEKHLNSVVAQYKKVNADVIPVIKGNGYGFGRQMLAKETSSLALGRIAIGTVYELDQALSDFGGEIIVLEPFSPADTLAIPVWEQAMQVNAHRVIAVLAGSHFAPASRVGIKKAFLEGKTSTHRFGSEAVELLSLINGDQHNITMVGLNLHLPIVDPVDVKLAQLETSALTNSRKTSNRVVEIAAWLNSFAPVMNSTGQSLNLNLSHVSPKEVTQVFEVAKERNYDVSISVRLGTSFWLGDPKVLEVTGTVLEIHELTGDHEHVGYRQVDSHGFTRLLVVSGGTSHGVALAAPTSRQSLRAKGVALVEGFGEAFGKIRSPFKLDGKNLVFAEPPHMHVSLLWCEDRKIKVGDQLSCAVRNTTSSFDVIKEH